MQGASLLRCDGGVWLLRRDHGLFDRLAGANSLHKWLVHEQMLLLPPCEHCLFAASPWSEMGKELFG